MKLQFPAAEEIQNMIGSLFPNRIVLPCRQRPADNGGVRMMSTKKPPAVPGSCHQSHGFIAEVITEHPFFFEQSIVRSVCNILDA